MLPQGARSPSLPRTRRQHPAAPSAPPAAAPALPTTPLNQVLFRAREADTRAQLPGLQQPCPVLVRLANHPDAFRAISTVKADSIGRLVSVRGTVVRATTAQPLVVEMEFVCGKCGAPQRVPFPDGRFAPPAGCAEHGCRSRTFAPNRAASRCIDWQRVALQVRGEPGLGVWAWLLRDSNSALSSGAICRQLPGLCMLLTCRLRCPPCWPQGLPRDEKGSGGRVPVPISVELTEDLVGGSQGPAQPFGTEGQPPLSVAPKGRRPWSAGPRL